MSRKNKDGRRVRVIESGLTEPDWIVDGMLGPAGTSTGELKLAGNYLMQTEKYSIATRDILTLKAAYRLGDELKQDGYWVSTIPNKSQANVYTLCQKLVRVSLVPPICALRLQQTLYYACKSISKEEFIVIINCLRARKLVDVPEDEPKLCGRLDIPSSAYLFVKFGIAGSAS
ncbi:NYN domain, limkain-b1-type [Artemisia annua]|uniref:NYN domain, limkain-b1-type n=1 Tax=Artemisia annua TaxID=35608 RepID=A0A2U1MTJ1_ARTAN|nr:NYN domain, limkain-b1-type [Artemisia annua]